MNIRMEIPKYLEYCKQRKGLSNKTIQAYYIDLGQFAKIVDSPDPDKRAIESYIEGLHREYNPRTVRRKIASVRAFYHHLERQGRIAKSLYQMLEVPEEINLVDSRHVTYAEMEMFESDLKAFLVMIKDCFDEEGLKSFAAIHREAWHVLSAIKNDRRYREYIDSIPESKREQEFDINAVLDYIEARGEEKGLEKGAGQVDRLGLMLAEAGRTAEFISSLSDRELQKKLLLEFGLEGREKKHDNGAPD